MLYSEYHSRFNLFFVRQKMHNSFVKIRTTNLSKNAHQNTQKLHNSIEKTQKVCYSKDEVK